MSRRVKCWLAVALLVPVLTTAVFWLRRAAEPTHHGRSVSEWFALSLGPKHHEAVEAMRAMGPEAVPYLRDQLRDRDGIVRRLRWTLTPKLPLTLRRRIPLPVPAARTQAQAASLLGTLGTDGRAAEPEMLRLLEEYLENPTTNPAAGMATSVQIPAPRAVAALNWTFDSNYPISVVLAALDQIGTENPCFIEPLTLLATNRFHAQSAFAVLGSHSFRPVVVSNMTTIRGFLKKDEAHQLGGMIALAPLLEQYPGLNLDFLPLIESSSPRVRGQAAITLQFAEAHFDRIVPSLVGALWDENATGEIYVLRAMRVSSMNRTNFVPSWPLFRQGISWSAVEPPASYRVRSVSLAAGESLAALAEKSPLVIPALIPALDSTNRFLQIAAIDVLARIGPPSAAALPALKTLLQSDDRQVRYAAAYALWIIGQDPAALVPFRVEEMLQDRDWAAVKFLGDVRASDEPVIVGLMEVLKDEDWRVRAWAAKSLGKIGSAAAVAVPALRLASRQDPHAIVRGEATDALGMINGGTNEAPSLRVPK